MRAAFVVTLELEDASTAAGTAELLQESLLDDGFNVISVNAWDRPSLGITDQPAGPLDQASQPLF